jgi:hypothetical protein
VVGCLHVVSLYAVGEFNRALQAAIADFAVNEAPSAKSSGRIIGGSADLRVQAGPGNIGVAFPQLS